MQKIYKTTTAIACLLAAAPAFADDEAIMEQLRAMQAQIAQMNGEISTLKKELSSAKEQVETARKQAASAEKTAAGAREAAALSPAAGKASAAPKEASGSDVKFTLSPGPKFETADGEYSFKLGGFAQIDAGAFSDDRRDHPDGTTVRRARLSASGVIAKDFNYKIENDFAGNASALTDVYLQYTGLDPVAVTIGQFKEPFGLETLTSDLFTSFVERAASHAFSPDRKIGVALSAYGRGDIGAWTAAGGFFGAGTGTASTDDEAKDFTGRLTLAPIAEKTEVLHFGIAGSHRIPDAAAVTGAGTDVYRVSSRPETALTSSQAVDTGNMAGVDSVNLLGLEAAAVWGPFSAQGEYVLADVERRSGLSDPTFSGYYAEISYFLTGESRNYDAKAGRFDRVRPLNPFSLSKGGWGAWQVMARMSNLDLTDAGINGGEMNNMSLGVKWYPHSNVALLANYIKVDTNATAVTPGDDPDVWMLRTQFDF